MSCEGVQAALDARMLRPAADPALRTHLETCAACREHERFVQALGAALDAEAPPALAPDLAARTRLRAVRALRAHAPAPARSFLGELLPTLAVLTLALPFTFAHAWLVAAAAVALLGGLLPPLLLEGLGVVYFGSLALAVGTLYALLPLWVVSIRRARTEAA